ncbi:MULTISPECIES: MarR family winged helix-turn-helix transcriptional regulator [Photobacterium]|uniref:MarR family transcriptional regulator n=1 Tax=Photobacterium ganghwense TaxID=320778 RepID=A0A0J1K185_9GAMM|nr:MULTISPECIES: MarR family transcriptional regulator [Photobacterium]KLV08202.1 MarR family transcriptional regulator [Photobacterium ganghwense]MBV1839243.1 MarR family transcriptional regulator [Photobacterium ganghwense]PSU07331.1 MarR family transcriptional regulator [Photobacterium ganghwense]QSV16065.1 MarR family transcriptional regulator [Photobacterium ganghwense]
MNNDHVDRVLQQWQACRPDLDCSPMGIIGRMSRMQRLIEKQLIAVFKQHNLNSIEFDILATLRRSQVPLTPTDLYQTLMLSSGAMSTRIEHLVQRGLIHRQASDQDRRSCTITLTDEGMDVINKAVEAHVANEHALLKPLSKEEQDQLADLMRRWLLSNENGL